MIAVPIGPVGGNRCPDVTTSIGVTIGRLRTQRIERAAIYAQFRARHRPSGGCDRIDGATQCRSAKSQRITAAIDFQMLEHLRIQLLKVSVVVGHVDRDAIL